MKLLLNRRDAKILIIITILLNLVLFLYSLQSTFWKGSLSSLTDNANEPQSESKSKDAGKTISVKDKAKAANKHIRKSITIVFRNFYNFENDLKDSIDSILDVVPNMPIVVLQEGVPYPPIVYEKNSSRTFSEEGVPSTVNFVNLSFDIRKSSKEQNPLSSIRTKYALLMPDSVRLSSKNILQKILRVMNSKVTKTPEAVAADEVVRHIIIVPFMGNMKSFSSCAEIKLDLPNWTIHYTAVNTSERCDLYMQKHAVLLDVAVLKELPEPFATPFPELLYIQAKMSNLTKTIFPLSFQDGRRLFVAYHTKQKRMDLRRRQFREMYKKLQIKRITRRMHKIVPKSEAKDAAAASSASSGSNHNIVLDTQQFSSSNFSLPLVTEIDLIGCERTTKSCIGPVYGNQPFYVYLGKNTPPCCRDKLKTTVNHVLEEFENVGIRYWLDNYSLKTAIETNELSPTAYDVDISFNVNDLERSNAMKKSQNKPYIDNEGFYWIKATDGHYFHVQFSKINSVGVNLLPYEISGNTVRPNGFFGWKAKDFSSDFLHPMSTVLFLNKNIMCPNNVAEYLELKNIK